VPPLIVVEIVLFVAGCLYALWRGGAPERLSGAVFLVAWGVSFVVENRAAEAVRQPGVLAVDAALLVFLCVLALRTRRPWAVWASVFQLLEVTSHVAVALDARVRTTAFLSALVMWSFLVLGALVRGTFAADRRRATGSGR
jgi:hypothetical protein